MHCLFLGFDIIGTCAIRKILLITDIIVLICLTCFVLIFFININNARNFAVKLENVD